MGMILRIASSRIVGQGDIVGRSGYFSLNLSANSVMRGRLDARRTLKSLVADLRLTIKVPNAMTANVALKLHPLGKEKVYFYEARPYILRNNPNADSLNIPLILYGSGWVDEQYGFMRFCGEREIDGNDKTGMILSNVPHYYVVGVELHKAAK